MKRLERAQKLMTKWSIKYVDAIEDYRLFISEALHHSVGCFLLDACCGSDSSSIEGFNSSVRKVGFDINLAELKRNTSIGHLVSGDLTVLPFKNDLFQVVCIHWGIEHIRNPDIALREIYRVLKPGGRVVTMTTNTWSPFYFLARITPHIFHEYIRKKFLEIEDEEAYRTYYRANTPFRMKKALYQAGFSKINLSYRGNPSVYAFSTITFLLGLLYEKITDFTFLKPLKMFIVSSGDKPTH